MNRLSLLAFAGCLCLSALPVSAQTTSDCSMASPKEAATPPAQGPSSGTAPGGMGSTAWSGGTGGSYVGTHPGAPTASSPNAQPATAGGLDPTKPAAGGGSKC